MRRVYIRGIMGLVWLVAAIACLVSGNMSMLGLFAIVGGVYLYSAFNMFKSIKNQK